MITSAKAPPRLGSLPLPNSSIKNKVFPLAFSIKCFMFFKWEEYVLSSNSRLCVSPMCIMSCLKIPISVSGLTETSSPACNITCSKPTVFKVTVLPPALGPLITSMLFCWSNLKLIGTVFLCCFWLYKSNSGWYASIRLIWPLSSKTG